MNLFAGPYDHEFGHELFSFQGHIRKVSSEHDKVTVCSKASMKFLYQDFADEFIDIESDPDLSAYANCKIISKDDCHKHVARSVGNVNLDQEFIKYGKPLADKYDILFHARAKEWGMCNNLGKAIYDELLECIGNKYKIAFIGTKKQAYCPHSAEDLRDLPLESLANVMCSSRLVVGESSGPIHFSSLCGAPHLTWGGYRLRTFTRYVHHWNPFKTDCYLFEKDDNYIDNRVRGGARLPKDILDQSHVNLIKIKKYREPTVKNLSEAINNILSQ